MAIGDRWPDRDDRSALSQAEPPALVALAPTPQHVPLTPGETCPDAEEIRALWSYQRTRNKRCGRRRMALALYEDGAPLEEIAAECGYKNAHTVSVALYDMGIPPRTKGPQA